MYALFFLVVVSLSISLVVFTSGAIFSSKLLSSFKELSPFECGFSSLGSARIPFSFHFFLICIIFVIFDVELVLLFPYLWNSPSVSGGRYEVTVAILFISFMMITTIMEWWQSSLEWES